MKTVSASRSNRFSHFGDLFQEIIKKPLIQPS